MEEVEEESYEERQRDELEFLQFVFMNDFEDLREKDTWKVWLDISLLLLLLSLILLDSKTSWNINKVSSSEEHQY